MIRKADTMFYDLLKSRRSIRKFRNKELEKEKIDTILKSALLSPSSRGIRPWEFIVVTQKELLLKLSKSKEHGSAFLQDAPTAVVVIADPAACDVWIEDASIASIIIQLAAHSLGIGSCWIQIRKRGHRDDIKSEDYVKEVLGIPERSAVESIIALGYPAEEKKANDDQDASCGKIHYQQY